MREGEREHGLRSFQSELFREWINYKGLFEICSLIHYTSPYNINPGITDREMEKKSH